MKRRTKQQAQRRKALALDQVPKLVHKGHNAPFAHRLCRKSPKELRKSVTGMVNKWKTRCYSMKGLGNLAENISCRGQTLRESGK